jgi:hypothetical protein
VTPSRRSVHRATILALLAAAAACSSANSIAGSFEVLPDRPYVLRMQSPSAIDLEVQLWNRGPAEVAFERRLPRGGDPAAGTLPPDRDEVTWHATTTELEIVLSTAAGNAVVAYTMRASGVVSLFVAPANEPSPERAARRAPVLE